MGEYHFIANCWPGASTWYFYFKETVMETHAFILIGIVILEFVLGFYILFRNPKSDINISYSLFIFSIALWGLFNAVFILINDLNEAFIWGKMTYLMAGLIITNFLYFSWVFPFKRTEFNLPKKLIILLPNVLILIFLLTSKLLVANPIFRHGTNDLTLGPAYNFYVLFFVGYWIWGLINLISKYKTSDGIHRWQLKWLLWGIIVTSIFAMTTNLFLPWFKVTRFGLVGPESSIVWLGFTSYIIFMKR